MIGIYKITNKINGKCYVGKSINIEKRIWTHKNNLKKNIHQNKHLQNSWNKYGSENFQFQTVQICQDIYLNDKQIYYIQLYNCKQPNGYNRTNGGQGISGLYITQQFRQQKRQQRIKWNNQHPDFYKQLGQKFKKKFENNPQLRQRSRQKTLQQFKDEQFYREYLQYRRSDYFRQHMKQMSKGKKMSQHAKQLLHEKNSKKVLCVQLNKQFESATDAQRYCKQVYNKHINVKAVCEGKRKTTCGFHWKYI